jgi:hypothetical protein
LEAAVGQSGGRHYRVCTAAHEFCAARKIALALDV